MGIRQALERRVGAHQIVVSLPVPVLIVTRGCRGVQEAHGQARHDGIVEVAAARQFAGAETQMHAVGGAHLQASAPGAVLEEGFVFVDGPVGKEGQEVLLERAQADIKNELGAFGFQTEDAGGAVADPVGPAAGRTDDQGFFAGRALGFALGPAVTQAKGVVPGATGQAKLVVVDLVAFGVGAEGAGIHGEVDSAPEGEAVVVQAAADVAIIPPEIRARHIGQGKGGRVEQAGHGPTGNAGALGQKPAVTLVVQEWRSGQGRGGHQKHKAKHQAGAQANGIHGNPPVIFSGHADA